MARIWIHNSTNSLPDPDPQHWKNLTYFAELEWRARAEHPAGSQGRGAAWVRGAGTGCPPPSRAGRSSRSSLLDGSLGCRPKGNNS